MSNIGEIFDEVLKHEAIRRGSGNEMLRADLIEAKQAILQDLMEIVGSNEEAPTLGEYDRGEKTWEEVKGRNKLRAEQRKAILKYMGVESE